MLWPTANSSEHEAEEEENSKCRYGCQMIESMYHIFVGCRRFRELRDEARRLVVKRVEKWIDEYKFEESHATRLLEAAKLFFFDSDLVWWLHYSAYYLGHVPKLDSLISAEAFTNASSHAHFLHNIHGDFHLAGIHLASHMWGTVQKDMAK